MRQRCKNPRDRQWPNYGGRGITVCERWQTFEHFYADMGDPPPGMSLDRIDNDGPYGPENCRWATRTEQQHNTRRNVVIAFNGRTQVLAAWATETGISYRTLQNRRAQGDVPPRLFRPVVRQAGGAVEVSR